MDSIVSPPLTPEKKSYIEILTPVSQNMTFFRNRVIADIIGF